jgi:hypothetical protein
LFPQGYEPAIHLAEDAGVVAADEEDLVALQVEVTVQGQGQGQHLHGGDQDIEGLGEQGDAGWSSISMRENWWLWGLKGNLSTGRKWSRWINPEHEWY